MKITWTKESDPYEVVGDYIFNKYYSYGCCFNFIVRIKQKYASEEEYRETNELLFDDGEDYLNPKLVWMNDWWEGEQDVELIGCVPIDELEYPYNEKWLL